jgi:3-hydroxyisobutyrate dehydrogenase-like beta-hydroxyacid dehydrogenase
MNVTFIGLGIMGQRMARHLLNHQLRLTVYNRSPEPARQLAEQGARMAASLAEAVQEADIVFTMLASPEAVEQVEPSGRKDSCPTCAPEPSGPIALRSTLPFPGWLTRQQGNIKYTL